MKDYIKSRLCAAIDEIPLSELTELCGSRLGGILNEITEILADASNDDFMCVENIVELLENDGFNCGCRHDF